MKGPTVEEIHPCMKREGASNADRKQMGGGGLVVFGFHVLK